jgi:hypothetical protein
VVEGQVVERMAAKLRGVVEMADQLTANTSEV